MKMNKVFLLLVGLLSLPSVANELLLITDTSKASGEVRLYIKNISGKDQSVLTRNLTLMQGKNEVTLSPDRHVLIKDRTQIILKEDLAYYGIVHLKTGETTYIRNPRVNSELEKVKYKINKSWGDMHGIWSGAIEASISK
jgi:hypothetical protein